MVIDWNLTTAEEEKAILLLFKNYEIKVSLAPKFNAMSDKMTLAELSNIDLGLVSDADFRRKLISLNSSIVSFPDDEIVGAPIFISVSDDLIDDGEKIKVTYRDLYVYLRTVLKLRKKKRDARSLEHEIAEAKALVDATKTTTERRKEAKDKLAELLNSKKGL